MKYALKSLFATALAAVAVAGQAAVVQIDGTSTVFAGAAPLTFTEAALGSTNPAIGSVTFGSVFAGQTYFGQDTAGVGPCGGLISNCVLGNPTGPLALAAGGTTTIVNDPNAGTSPVLSGSSSPFTLGNPIAMLFAQDVSAVSFDAGGFNNVGSTQVTVFSRTGAILFQILNPVDGTGLPVSFFNFAFGSTDAAGNASNTIAGILISLIGVEIQGFAIDNVRTVVTASTTTSSGTTSSSEPPGQTPEPTSLALVGLALIALGAARLRKA